MDTSQEQYGFRRSGQFSYCQFSQLAQGFKTTSLTSATDGRAEFGIKMTGVVDIFKHTVWWMLFPYALNLVDIKNCEFNNALEYLQHLADI